MTTDETNDIVLVYWDQPHKPTGSDEAQLDADLDSPNENERLVR